MRADTALCRAYRDDVGNVCRFVVKAEDGRRSAEWRVWTGRERGEPKDDVYLAPSSQIVDLKVSLHPATGHGQHGLSESIRAAARPGDRQALSRWELTRSEAFEGWEIWYVLQFPEQELAAIPMPETPLSSVAPSAAAGNSLYVLVVVGGPGAVLPSDLSESVIAELDRGNGGKVALIGAEVPFDASVLEEVDQAPDHLMPWDVPGLRAPSEPFGWIVDVFPDGTRRATEFDGSVRNDRRAAKFALPDFPGVLRPWSDKPAYLDDRGLLCAILVVPPSGPAELFVDFRARCNHMHLSSDAGDLVAAARRGQIDHGWSALPDGSLATGIGARRVFEELGGLTEEQWARGPTDPAGG